MAAESTFRGRPGHGTARLAMQPSLPSLTLYLPSAAFKAIQKLLFVGFCPRVRTEGCSALIRPLHGAAKADRSQLFFVSVHC